MVCITVYRLTEYQTTTTMQAEIQPQPQPQLNEEDAAAARLNRDQLMELFDQQDAAAREWNASPDVQEELRRRVNILNNTQDYYTGNNAHCFRSIQMTNADNWDLLFGGPYAQYLHNDAAEYGAKMIQNANDPPNAPLVFETLYVSLLLQQNVRPGVHRVIFIIYADPHHAMLYGHMVRYEVEDAGEQYHSIENLFDVETPRVIVERCTEYDILSFLADEYEMRDLLGVFLRGLNSQQFVENDPDYPIYPHACSGMLRGLLELGNPRRREGELLPAAPAPAPVVADAADAADADDADEEDVYEIIAIPPPPPRPMINNDIAQMYQFYYNNERDEGDNYREAVRARRAENNQVWNDLRDDNYHHHHRAAAAAAHDDIIDNRDGNIIGYWLENDYRINQYLDIQEERRRNSAEAAAEALAAANAPFVAAADVRGDVRADINEDPRVQG
jgi:hypothetical protein